MSSPKHFKLNSKKALYLLFKKTNRKLWEFRGNKGAKIDHANLEILRRLKTKGLIDMTKFSDGNIYYLTIEGKNVAKPIVNEVDEYKRW
jgi:uncharacterized protein YjhX (UPF0386 family)